MKLKGRLTKDMKQQENMIAKYDSQMRPTEVIKENILWYSPKQDPFVVSGLAWFAEEGKYRRLPTEPKAAIPEAVDYLANHPTGGQIRFQTDSNSLSVRVKLTGKADMPHMPATGQCGVDCYVGPQDNLQYVNTTKYPIDQTEYESTLFSNNTEIRNVVLFLPLYQGVEEIEIGLQENATLLPPPDYVSDNKIIVYGTSITQGGCASRPGMLYTNILSRNIPMEFYNLGFSGSGKGEPEVAEVIAGIQNPACIVLDYEGNCVSTELFQQTLPEFIRILREAHPDTKILVVSRIRYSREENFSKHMYEVRMERKQFQQNLINELRSNGDQHIFFFDGSTLLGESDYNECTVDGSHPTDLGFLRMANGLAPALKTLVL